MHLFTADNFPSSFLHFAKLSSEIPEPGLGNTFVLCKDSKLVKRWYSILVCWYQRPITLYSLKLPRAFMVDDCYLLYTDYSLKLTLDVSTIVPM